MVSYTYSTPPSPLSGSGRGHRTFPPLRCRAESGLPPSPTAAPQRPAPSTVPSARGGVQSRAMDEENKEEKETFVPPAGAEEHVWTADVTSVSETGRMTSDDFMLCGCKWCAPPAGRSRALLIPPPAQAPLLLPQGQPLIPRTQLPPLPVPGGGARVRDAEARRLPAQCGGRARREI